jgi:nitroreductase
VTVEFGDVVRNRRSIRSFTDRPVPEDVLTEILEAARLAPSSGNRHNQFFGVITDEATRRELAQAAGGQEWVAQAPVVMAFCVRLGADPASLPADDFGLVVNRARFGQGWLDHLGDHLDRRTAQVFWENGSPLIPGEHVHLAATAHGLGSCWIGHLDVPRAGAVLGLPGDMVCLYLMPIGYPAEEPQPVARRELDECVFRGRWLSAER